MQFLSQFWVSLGVYRKPLLPLVFSLFAFFDSLPEMSQSFIGDLEFRFKWPAKIFLCLLHFFCAQRFAMGLEAILFIW
jgi:hypothetical protein